MKTKILLLFVSAWLLCSCSGVMVVNGKVMGVSSGKFIYQDGYLTLHYKADIDSVWRACETTVIDLKGSDIQKDRKIAGGSIKTVISEENVTILVNYIEKDLVSVSVICGVAGNKMASRIIQDKITANTGKP